MLYQCELSADIFIWIESQGASVSQGVNCVMSRHKLSAQFSYEDDQVSIFDSEEQENTKAKVRSRPTVVQAPKRQGRRRRTKEQVLEDQQDRILKRIESIENRKKGIQEIQQVDMQVKKEVESNTKEHSSSSGMVAKRTRRKKPSPVGQLQDKKDSLLEQDVDVQHLKELADNNPLQQKLCQGIQREKVEVPPFHLQTAIDEPEVLRIQKEIKQKAEQLGSALVRQRALQRRRMFVFEEMQRLQTEYQEIGRILQSEGIDSQIMKQFADKYKKVLTQQWRKHLGNLPVKEKESGRKIDKSKSESRMEMLEKVIEENPFLTQAEMAEVIKKMDPAMNARVERSVVLRLLKANGYKKKRVRWSGGDRNSQELKQERYQYALRLRQLQEEGCAVFYYDEMLISEYFDKESGWCRGDAEVVFRQEKLISRSVVVLAVMNSRGDCHWDAKFGNYSPQLYCQTLSKLLKSAGLKQPQKLLVVRPMAHRTPNMISQVVIERGWRMILLPSDAFGLNPLQSFFSEVREQLKRRPVETIEDLFRQAVGTLNDSDREGWGRRVAGRVGMFMDRALNMEAF